MTGQDGDGAPTPVGSRVTLEDVAARAGVSRQTVSNVLNAPERVRPDTERRVRSVIDELGYRPYLAARQLMTRRSRLLGMRLDRRYDDINGVVLDRFLHALTQAAWRARYRVILFTAESDLEEVDQVRELRSTLDVEGFVLTGTHHDDTRTAALRSAGVPFVSFGRPWSTRPSGAGHPDHAWVDVDGAAGTTAATGLMFQHARRRVGFVGWPAGSGVGDDRRRGWLRALAAVGQDARADTDRLQVTATDGVQEGADAMRRLLRLAPDVDGVVCASDSLALGALAACQAQGRGDIAVSGFDDTPVAAAVGLTSVAQPLEAAADACIEILLGQVDGRSDSAARTRLLLPHLVPRGAMAGGQVVEVPSPTHPGEKES